jgi:hypothetical protein
MDQGGGIWRSAGQHRESQGAAGTGEGCFICCFTLLQRCALMPTVLAPCPHLYCLLSPVLPCSAALLYCPVLPQARHRNPKTPELWLAAIRTEQRAGSTKAAEALLAKGLQVCVLTREAWGGGGGSGCDTVRVTKEYMGAIDATAFHRSFMCMAAHNEAACECSNYS